MDTNKLSAIEVKYAFEYRQNLSPRVAELVAEYGERVDDIYSELDRLPYKITELHDHYVAEQGEFREARELLKLQRALLSFARWNDSNGEFDNLTTRELVTVVNDMVWNG